ncbi:chromosome partitioning protein ParA [Saccharobesus litoralis]|uniref:Chromosome partitioning protein ParA n=1 Tax=Saccharobesus litoralis TaxID=2172099 RepID=A0A2S0VTJ2_9ALTE|nr:AAA family ATPase [Saccharobesus litoralis]AWB67529.1 chromosome partitioning protein ParA [Saccharobesus litoralis]
MILLVGGEKGGSGKSCLAQNLAVYFAHEQNASVMLVDCDPQRTTSDWIQARHNMPELAWINCVQLYGKIRYELMSFESHYDVVVIDCGGQDSTTLRAAMSVATHILLPLRPKRRDLKTLPHMEELVSACSMINPNMKATVVMTQCPSLPTQANRILDAKECCRSYGLNVLNAVTYARNIYDDSEEQGASVLELDSSGKAADEIRHIIDELILVEAEEVAHGVCGSETTLPTAV